MKRDSNASTRSAGVETEVTGDIAIITVSGHIDEKFSGFGSIRDVKAVVIDVSGLTRMTSFGVRQWMRSMDALPKGIDAYLLGCPTFFVDQLNMVLNFGGPSKILTVGAPYSCPSCGVESSEIVDVLAERANLAKGQIADRSCSRCGVVLEFAESPESYFSFVSKYGASHLDPSVGQLLASKGRYTAVEAITDKPPRIIKLVHGQVTYFRIIGTIGVLFRARPLLVGAEGEVVIDLAEVSRFDAAGLKEWNRLVKTLAGQVPSVTLVDISEEFLLVAGSSLTVARNVAVASVLVASKCEECGRLAQQSETLLVRWPREFGDAVCPTCGGTTESSFSAEAMVPLQKASTSAPAASAKLFDQRAEILSRALTDANVAQAGDAASAVVGADDTLLGKYKIVRRLSEGGMAEVFLANQVGIGGFEKPVALKRIQRKLLDTRHLAIELFLNEAKIAGRLMHPNIVQVLDVGEEQGALYLAMEYVRGKDLRNIIKKLQAQRAVMPVSEALYVAREVATALHHAYWSTDMAGKQVSVVHRDVSPHNIILSFEGAVKLLDFGVAMSAVTEHAQTMIVGKWLYMSPESTLNEQVDHRSDLFSLGVILYLLCSGYMPFSGPEPKDIVKKIRAGAYKPLKQVAPAVPERLASLVSRLLAPSPADRPQRGQEVVAAINDIAREYGLTSSASKISAFLSQLYPEDSVGAGISDTGPIVKEIVRAYPDEGGSLTVRDTPTSSPAERSPMSVTPVKAPPDVSETFRRPSGVFDVEQISASMPSTRLTPRPDKPKPAARLAPRIDPPRLEPAPMAKPRVQGKTILFAALAVLGAVLAGVVSFLLVSR